MNLPIDVVPDTNPPRFFWKQTVQSPIGPREVGYEGLLPPHVEGAVAALVVLAKQQAQEIATWKQTIEDMAAQLDAQKAELIETPPEHLLPPAPKQFLSKKGKGAG